MDAAAKGERLHVINNRRQKKTQTEKRENTKMCCLSKLGYIVFESNQQPPCVCVMIAGSRIGINHREIVGGWGGRGL